MARQLSAHLRTRHKKNSTKMPMVKNVPSTVPRDGSRRSASPLPSTGARGTVPPDLSQSKN